MLLANSIFMFDLSILHFIIRINNEFVKDFNNIVKTITRLSKNQYCQITYINRLEVSSIVFIKSNMRDFKTTKVRKVINDQK